MGMEQTGMRRNVKLIHLAGGGEEISKVEDGLRDGEKWFR